MSICKRIKNSGAFLHQVGRSIEKRIVNRKTVSTVFQAEIIRRRGMVSNSTVENELTAYRSFLAFGGGDVALEHLTTDCMMRYERWLMSQGVCPNTSACYMRSLRAVSNRLGLDGNALFRNVKTTKDKADKKAVDVGAVNKLSAAELPQGTFLSLARDVFIFSIMAMGIPFIDLANLRKSNLRDGFIVYHRHKTGKRVAVKIEPCMEAIINRHRGGKSPYLFPLLTETETREAETEYRRLIGRYNRALQRLSGIGGLERKVTSYTARHTWATLALKKGMKLGAISKALAHTSLVTTQNYIKEIDDEGLFEANRRLIQEIFVPN